MPGLPWPAAGADEAQIDAARTAMLVANLNLGEKPRRSTGTARSIHEAHSPPSGLHEADLTERRCLPAARPPI